MAGTPADVADLVKTLVLALVDEPNEVEVTYAEEGSTTVVEISCAPDDVGKVIGRQGRIIKSIRTLARAAASYGGFDAEVEILD